MRIVFMGTPVFAVPTLAALLDTGHEVASVYTRAPAPGGRGMAEKLSPVHAFATRRDLPVLTPKTLRTEDAAEALKAARPEAVVVVAYGMILPQAILDVPPLGCLNLHGSLLPRWRGAAPIQRAVMAGDRESGVAVMRMEAGLDTGPVALEERVAITPDMTAGELHDALAPIGAALMARAVAALERGALSFRPQPEEGVVYARKIDKAEARIDWSRPAAEIANLIRGLSPSPGAFFEADLGRGGERVKVLDARVTGGNGVPGTVLDHCLAIACGEGAVALTEVQRAGKGVMRPEDFLRGARLETGRVLGSA